MNANTLISRTHRILDSLNFVSGGADFTHLKVSTEFEGSKVGIAVKLDSDPEKAQLQILEAVGAIVRKCNDILPNLGLEVKAV